MATATGQAPIKRTHRITTPAVAQAATAAFLTFVAPYACTVTSVKFVPTTGITGAATNNRVHTAYNRGQAGSGTTKIAELIYDSGVNSTSKVAKVITLSGTPANLDLAAGDVVEVESKFQGTGIADAGGLWEIVTSRN